MSVSAALSVAPTGAAAAAAADTAIGLNLPEEAIKFVLPMAAFWRTPEFGEHRLTMPSLDNWGRIFADLPCVFRSVDTFTAGGTQLSDDGKSEPIKPLWNEAQRKTIKEFFADGNFSRDPEHLLQGLYGTLRRSGPAGSAQVYKVSDIAARRVVRV